MPIPNLYSVYLQSGYHENVSMNLSTSLKSIELFQDLNSLIRFKIRFIKIIIKLENINKYYQNIKKEKVLISNIVPN